MTKLLPERPDLGQLKKQAKDLLDAVQAGRAEALGRLAADDDRETFVLHDAQRVLAREYGFTSWAKLKLHVETRTADAAEVRLVEAALEKEEEIVRAILAERPALATRSVFTAAALGDAETVRQALKENVSLAKQKVGPRTWKPLLYVCFGQLAATKRAGLTPRKRCQPRARIRM